MEYIYIMYNYAYTHTCVYITPTHTHVCMCWSDILDGEHGSIGWCPHTDNDECCLVSHKFISMPMFSMDISDTVHMFGHFMILSAIVVVVVMLLLSTT